MPIEILQGLAIPFLGTTLGAACVFLLRGELDHRIQKAFTGFAAGIMVAASVWSLLIPSMEESSALGAYASLPAVAGFWAGTLFLLLLDHIIPHLHLNSEEAEGPSSSHTAGAVRLGLMARKVLGEPAVRADINLHGSFAQTYRGHGTDKALIAGILGFAPDDERIREALAIAEEQGLVFSFQKVNLEQAHPNTAVIHLTGASGRTVRVRGASVGGGNIRITNIDGYEVELTGAYPALITIHHDKPGIITKVTQILARYEYNIAFMRVSRQSRGEMAMMILELDEPLSGDVVAECCAVYEVETAFAIPAI